MDACRIWQRGLSRRFEADPADYLRDGFLLADLRQDDYHPAD